MTARGHHLDDASDDRMYIILSATMRADFVQFLLVCVCVCMCVCVRVRACVRACVRSHAHSFMFDSFDSLLGNGLCAIHYNYYCK